MWMSFRVASETQRRASELVQHRHRTRLLLAFKLRTCHFRNRSDFILKATRASRHHRRRRLVLICWPYSLDDLLQGLQILVAFLQRAQQSFSFLSNRFWLRRRRRRRRAFLQSHQPRHQRRWSSEILGWFHRIWAANLRRKGRAPRYFSW